MIWHESAAQCGIFSSIGPNKLILSKANVHLAFTLKTVSITLGNNIFVLVC